MANLAAKFQQACTLHRHGEVLRAKLLYEEVLRKDPKHSGALGLLGLIAGQSGDWRRAAQLYGRVVNCDPGNAAAHNNRGLALQGLQQWEAAAASFDKAVKIRPDYLVAQCNHGNALMKLERYDGALLSYERAVSIDPKNPAAHCNLGYVHEVLQRPEEALASYDRALALKADFAEAHYNRANVLKARKQWNVALSSYDRAIEHNPSFAAAHRNRGLVFQELQQWDAALASYDLAIASKADFADAQSDRGNALRELGRWEEAIAGYDRAIDIEPEHAAAHTNRGMARLLLADFSEGWRDYEWRWRLADTSTLAARREFIEPRWTGEPISGKSILLHDEQGLGDTLQFCRYAKLVSALGARVILEVHSALAGVVKTLPEVSQVLVRGEPLPLFDCHCPLLSLPLAFDTQLDSIPAFASYLSADPVKVGQWRDRIGHQAKPRVGLVWRGSTPDKSLPVADFMRILPPQLAYVSLQKELPEEDRAALTNSRILDVADDLHDFSDTAAVCACLDLVVSVDTSVAHLSGALGIPTWILLRSSADWRWLQDRFDSPWYPSATLYRQARVGEWHGVLARLAADLQALVRDPALR